MKKYGKLARIKMINNNDQRGDETPPAPIKIVQTFLKFAERSFQPFQRF